jgi:WD40 repeat protein
MAIQQILPGGSEALVKELQNNDGLLYAMNLKSGKLIQILDFPISEARYTAGYLVYVRNDGRLNAVQFDPGKHVVSGSDDHSVRIWDTGTDAAKHLYNHRVLFTSISFHSGADTSGALKEHICHSALDLKYVPLLEMLPPPFRYNPTASPLSALPQDAHRDHDILHLSSTSPLIHFRSDGWVVTSKRDTNEEYQIIWLPSSLRPWHPPTLVCISQEGFTSIDLSGCTFGDRWFNIHVG